MKSFGLLLVCGTLAAAPPPLPKFPPLEFHPPKPERLTLDNGLTIYLLEDHELPLIKVNVLIRSGSQYEPADKVGLHMIFGEAMSDGGTATHPPEEIEKTLDRRAAGFSFGMGTEDASGGMSCRAGDFDEIF